MSDQTFIEGSSEGKLHISLWGGRRMLCGFVIPLYVGMTQVSEREAKADRICSRCLKTVRRRQFPEHEG